MGRRSTMEDQVQTRTGARFIGVICLMVVLAVGFSPVVDAKTRIENLDDLPRFSYPVEGSVVGIITSDEAFDEFAAKVRTDIEGVLEKYEIDDAATLQGFYGTLSRLDFMSGDYEAALARIQAIRELETKEAGKLMTGLFAKAWVAARDEVDPGADFEAFAGAFATHLDALVSVLPWDVVQDTIKEAKGRAEIFSENFVLGVAKSQVDPAVTASGEVSSDLVPTVVALRYALTTTIPLNNEVVDVYGRLVAANKVAKDNIWLTRNYILGRGRGKKEDHHRHLGFGHRCFDLRRPALGQPARNRQR